MANEKILVVDDDANICELLRLYLTKEGYQVTVANDGEEGLEKFNAVKPDMVLLDVMMPRMDGLEVCRRIRKAGNTPVMMLTAKGETFDKVLGLELGADDYMVKPVDEEEMLWRIEALLRRYRSTAGFSFFTLLLCILVLLGHPHVSKPPDGPQLEVRAPPEPLPQPGDVYLHRMLIHLAVQIPDVVNELALGK